jgi:hypothetical protein
MLKKILKLTTLGSSLLALVSCSSAVDFSELTSGYDKAMELTAEENILLNIVRSSKNKPLHFTAISGVSGSSYLGYGSASIAAPFDQLLSFSRNGASFSTLNTPSFEQISSFGLSPLNTSEFLTGILNQISPKELTYYTAQGFPRELLFNLVIDSLEVSLDGITKTVVNDPSHPDYSDFVDLLNSLLELGISTETVSNSVPQGPVLTAVEAADPNRIQINSSSGFTIRKTNNEKPYLYQAYATSTYSRFCFLPRIAKSRGIPSSMLCSHGDTNTLVEDGSLKIGNASKKFKNASLKVTTRSTRRVFEYLGKLVYLQNNGSEVISLRTNSSKEYNYLNEGDGFFVVKKNNTKGDDIISVKYDGDTYSIPKEGQGFSATVLGITFELLNLGKSVDSLPPPTTIRLQ